MRKIWFCCLLILFNNTLFGQQNLIWEVQHPVTKKWLPFGEKGSVQEAFIQAKLMPDPFVGMNELKFGWFENYTWKLRAHFKLSAEMKAATFVDLDFPSLDTYAKVYVNDSLVATTENAFIHYHFPVKKWLKNGLNTVVVVFIPPVAYQKDKLKQVGTILPAPNDVGKIQVAPHCRKPQYQFGWDWSLRMLTMGFWEPVKLEAYSNNLLLNKQARTLDLSTTEAKQQYTFEFTQPLNGTFTCESSLTGNQTVKLQGQNMLQFAIQIKQPVLWWPRGQGAQYLYTDSIRISDQNGVVLVDTTLTFGLKSVVLIQEKDQWGTSFLFKINGKPMFCKGSDYIPDDIFPARITDSILRNRVQTMAACNFNMIRIWGGGMYPKEAFLDECDRQGIMVWQDFMFACAMYPGTTAFLANVKNELDQQIPRIAGHASVVYFNGNNEVDVAWHNWGFQQTYNLTKANEKLIESYYNKLFNELIPNTLEQYTLLPYVHTSPLSNWGKDEYFRHGTQHYWGVWHGKDPLEDFSRKAGRFNAEYGFQSFPEFYTLSQFSDSSQWNLASKVMKHHQKSYVGNGMIAKHANRLFGETINFKQFVYYAQLTQAKAVSMAVVSHRTSFPRTSGTLYWQMNDCWPAPSWSSLDYYGQWKALQYQIRDDYQETAIVARIDTLNREKYFLVQGNYAGFQSQIEAKIFDEYGNLIRNFECKRANMGMQVYQLFPQEFDTLDLDYYFVQFDWNDETGRKKQRVFVHEAKSRESNSVSSPEISLLAYDSLTNTGVLQVHVIQPVVDLWITHPTLPIHFENNFQNLLPGTYTISFSSPEKFDSTQLLLFYR